MNLNPYCLSFSPIFWYNLLPLLSVRINNYCLYLGILYQAYILHLNSTFNWFFVFRLSQLFYGIIFFSLLYMKYGVNSYIYVFFIDIYYISYFFIFFAKFLFICLKSKYLWIFYIIIYPYYLLLLFNSILSKLLQFSKYFIMIIYC